MSRQTNRHDLAVVGGGPAGLAAAERLAEAGHAVTVYERMPSVARRLLIAGRGGLNLTHSEALPDFLARYHPAGSLAPAIRAFPPEALRAWCEGLGQPTFVGSSGRVFPRAFKASPLLRAWLGRLDTLGVRIRTRHRLTAIEGRTLILDTPEGTLRHTPAAALVALGGASWPRLGSDGSWVAVMEGLGAAVAPLRPANVGFRVGWSEVFRTRFAGEPVKRVGLSAGGQRVLGEMVVTQTGLEGGAVYALGRVLREAAEAEGAAILTLDLRPDLAEAALAARLGRSRPGESAASRLRKAAGLAPVSAGLLRESLGGPLPTEPGALAARIKAARLALDGPEAIERAISTAGGLRGVDARFMLPGRPGLFAAGEMLDWEAPTGGYLLQGAFATGRAAAEGMLDWLGNAPEDRDAA
ncbi:TIGR03862 family flavoprotein [Methylobacterium gregans]|uniref:3-dehydro-bile acid delta(4,6)-reductase n=1 Tax=Methylobacterium gregans TaxID=374424 RepID=A0AA37M9V5_9HYPH|nr:TIGR03862 family flavoprotein [Methylobacterium gregans]MDQ0520267.1 putative flavoprotein (TIGR03862 family) [Methylobacterium gregans]GJD77657.1 3-dehydro-bile acid delta(4,6)-reductase [Methylobacterium gregans]GLS52672.1 NAD(FAD)-utilizing dehydrogenase [Methylobacterium gregans]